MTEKQFMAMVVKLARLYGWTLYHTFDSRRSAAGFPDLVLLRRGRLLVVELKSDSGRLTAAQERWLQAFEDAGVDARCWAPRDWPEIERVLSRN